MRSARGAALWKALTLGRFACGSLTSPFVGFGPAVCGSFSWTNDLLPFRGRGVTGFDSFVVADCEALRAEGGWKMLGTGFWEPGEDGSMKF